MRWNSILRLSCAALLFCNGVSTPAGFALQRRQESLDSPAPTLTSNDGVSPSTTPLSPTTTKSPSEQSSSGPTSNTTRLPESEGLSAEPSREPTSSLNTTSTVSASSTSASIAPSSAATNGTAAHEHKQEHLPIEPRITPGLSVGGVILILSGVVYNLVGVKNEWVHISLSTAYLASIAVTVLIDYVMNPPISDGIQGAYFVGIFMTGVMFGAGSLIFKEVTEGLGCLLGGFCVSMWFLTLKPGGLITNAAGKGIFIAVFCVVFWSLSFSHYTRAYALIGSTAFGGATAFVLGIDCFSRAGLKEFWFYVWDLNDDLFPLGTTTYPMTRGIRVEVIAIILVTIIGVISQIKLWKIVRNKKKRKEEERHEEERRNDVVDHALGRQIERQNDRDRPNWEKQYGSTLQSKRTTVLWSDAHPDKSYTHISTLAKRSSSSESLEMASFGPKRQTKLKRQSSAPSVAMIPEEGEEQDIRTSMERRKTLDTLQKADASKKQEPTDEPLHVVPLPFKIPAAPHSPSTQSDPSIKSANPSLLQESKRASKRRSLQSMLGISPRLSTENILGSESQEALVLPSAAHSRTSSLAATIDEESDFTEIGIAIGLGFDDPSTPAIVVRAATSPEHRLTGNEAGGAAYDFEHPPPSPPALSERFEFDDPEELSRPMGLRHTITQAKDALITKVGENQSSNETKTSSATGSGPKPSSDSYANSHISTGQTTATEVLNKSALDHIPSHLSNVVLSYRTNEWAKHIATADAPVFDEPETIDVADDEAPTQLAPPSPVSPVLPSEKQLDGSKTLSASSKPPAPHVITLGPTGNIVANVHVPQKSMSDRSISKAPEAATPGKTMTAQSARASSSKAKPLNLDKKSTLVSTPIDENAPTDFALSQSTQQDPPVEMPQRVLSNPSFTISTPNLLSRSASAQGGQIYTLDQANSYASTSSNIHQLSRSSTMLGSFPAMRSDARLSNYDSDSPRPSTQMSIHAPGFRSETRLSSYESRQPQKRQFSNEAQRREQLLAEWRMSQQQGGVVNVAPQENIQARRAQMLSDMEQKRLLEDQARVMNHQKQMQIDQVMRRSDMQELHREAMRKMQADVAKKA